MGDLVINEIKFKNKIPEFVPDFQILILCSTFCLYHIAEMAAAWIDKQLKLVDMERQYDLDQTQQSFAALDPQTLQRKGQCLLNLRVTQMRSGLGGKRCAFGTLRILIAPLYRIVAQLGRLGGWICWHGCLAVASIS